MVNAIQLISDGDGLAVIGSPTAVEHFLASQGQLSLSMDLGLQRLGPLLRLGAGVAQAGSEIAANSGRWVKLTEESAQLVKKFGLMESKTPGVSHAMVGEPGSIKSWLRIVNGPGSFLTNPAILAGAGLPPRGLSGREPRGRGEGRRGRAVAGHDGPSELPVNARRPRTGASDLLRRLGA